MPSPLPLTVRPIEAADRAPLRALLDSPHLRRRHVFSGLRELHPVAWEGRRRTFAISLADTLLGSVELLRDEDDAGVWEISWVIERHERHGDGQRAAAAALYYAFEQLQVESVWFWVHRGLTPVERFAEQLGFQRSHTMRVPGDDPADVYELSAEAWPAAQPGLASFLDLPVHLSDGRRRWTARAGTFVEI